MTHGGDQFGKYTLIAKIGVGGMADVFLALAAGPRGLGFEKLVVIKRLREHLAAEEEFTTMLLDEARIAARLNHAGVVQTLEVGEINGSYFIAMEYLEGQSLHRIAHEAKKSGKALTPGDYGVVLVEVLDALQYAHNLTDYGGQPLNLVHRDVSPHNIFVTYDGRVKIVDFGIAKAVGRWQRTKTGVVKGKLRYMAPEQALGDDVDSRADLFSVGVVLWEGLTLRRLWQGVSDLDVMQRILSKDSTTIELPSRIAPDVPAAFDPICRRALAFKREERYQTAAEFRSDLEKAVRAAGVDASLRDVGSKVSRLFEQLRREMREVIEQRIAQCAAEQGGDAEMLVILPPISGTPSATTKPVWDSSESSVDISHLDDTTDIAGTKIATPAREGSKLRILVVAILAAVIGAAAFFHFSREPQPTTPRNSSAEPPVATPEITLTLRATPPEARFLIDNRTVDGNPYEGKFPADGRTHELRIEAPGYLPTQKTLKFSSDLVIDVTLRPQPAPDSSRPR